MTLTAAPGRWNPLVPGTGFGTSWPGGWYDVAFTTKGCCRSRAALGRSLGWRSKHRRRKSRLWSLRWEEASEAGRMSRHRHGEAAPNQRNRAGCCSGHIQGVRRMARGLGPHPSGESDSGMAGGPFDDAMWNIAAICEANSHLRAGGVGRRLSDGERRGGGSGGHLPGPGGGLRGGEARHGGFPVAISTTVQPTLQMSAWRPCPVCLMTSGAWGGRSGARSAKHSSCRVWPSSPSVAGLQHSRFGARGWAAAAPTSRAYHPVRRPLHALVSRLYCCEVSELLRRRRRRNRGRLNPGAARAAERKRRRQRDSQSRKRRPSALATEPLLDSSRGCTFLDAPKSASFTTPALSTRIFAPCSNGCSRALTTSSKAPRFLFFNTAQAV